MIAYRRLLLIVHADALGELTIAGSSPCVWPYGAPSLPVQHLPSQRAFLDVGVVEVFRRIEGHPDSPHHGLRAQVCRRGDRDHLGHPDRGKAVRQNHRRRSGEGQPGTTCLNSRT
jgi:hypothetical protein